MKLLKQSLGLKLNRWKMVVTEVKTLARVSIAIFIVALVVMLITIKDSLGNIFFCQFIVAPTALLSMEAFHLLRHW